MLVTDLSQVHDVHKTNINECSWFCLAHFKILASPCCRSHANQLVGPLFSTLREGITTVKARNWGERDASAETWLVEPTFLRQTKRTQINSPGGVTWRRGKDAAAGFLLRYGRGKCNYGWTGAWRSRCGCLKVCSSACQQAKFYRRRACPQLSSLNLNFGTQPLKLRSSLPSIIN